MNVHLYVGQTALPTPGGFRHASEKSSPPRLSATRTDKDLKTCAFWCGGSILSGFWAFGGQIRGLGGLWSQRNYVAMVCAVSAGDVDDGMGGGGR